MIDDLLKTNLEIFTDWCHKNPHQANLAAQIRQADTLWITATDSPLSPSTLTGKDPGCFVVLRTPGALVTPLDLACLAVLDMSLRTLQVSRIIVCGHYGCASIAQVSEGDAGDVGPLAHWLSPAREEAARHDAELGLIASTQARANRLCDLVVASQIRSLAASPMVADVWRRRRPLTLHGLIYSLHDGLLREVCDPVSGSRQARARIGGAA